MPSYIYAVVEVVGRHRLTHGQNMTSLKRLVKVISTADAGGYGLGTRTAPRAALWHAQPRRRRQRFGWTSVPDPHRTVPPHPPRPPIPGGDHGYTTRRLNT